MGETAEAKKANSTRMMPTFLPNLPKEACSLVENILFFCIFNLPVWSKSEQQTEQCRRCLPQHLHLVHAILVRTHKVVLQEGVEQVKLPMPFPCSPAGLTCMAALCRYCSWLYTHPLVHFLVGMLGTTGMLDSLLPLFTTTTRPVTTSS